MSSTAAPHSRLWKWIRANPEKVGNMALGLGALATATVSALVAILSLYVALKALGDQTATDHANRDVQIRSFPSNVSVVSANNGLLYIENLNSQPLAPFGLIIGVQADVNFSSDGFAYATAISWKRDYEIDGMGPCSQYSLDMSGNPGVADYSGLIFVDNDGLIWYRESGGLLVQVLLEPAQQISLPARFLRAPKYSSASYKGYKTFAGCS